MLASRPDALENESAVLAIHQALASLSSLSNIVLGLPTELIEDHTRSAVLDALELIAEDLVESVV